MLVWIYYNPNDAQRKEIQFALIHSVAMCFCHIQKKASPLCEIEGWSCIKVFRFVSVVKNVVFLLDLEQQLVLQSDPVKQTSHSCSGQFPLFHTERTYHFLLD